MTENKYLEKVAANAYRQHLINNGHNMEGISNASMLASIGSSNKAYSVDSGSKVQVKQRGFMGLGPDKVVGLKSSGTVNKTGDVLGKNNLAARLESFKANKAVAAAASPKPGLLGRALQFAKNRPLAAAGVAGGALAAGALGAKALRGNSQPVMNLQEYPQYG